MFFPNFAILRPQEDGQLVTCEYCVDLMEAVPPRGEPLCFTAMSLLAIAVKDKFVKLTCDDYSKFKRA